MKLIKVGELAEKLEISENCDDCKYCDCPFCEWNPNPVDICEAIFDAPEVEAIPVSWIEEYATCLEKPSDVYLAEKILLTAMIKKWREEKA